MKTNNYLTLLLILGITTLGFAQQGTTTGSAQSNGQRLLTIEPAIGIHTNFGTDLLITNLVQWNPHKRWSFGAYSSYSINNIMLKEFNHVKSDYNYSLNQKFGAGMMFNRKKASHTLMLMAGVKYTAYKETLNNPGLDKASISISAFSPDYGIMYSAKRGWKKYFFTYRMYLPLYPFPIKGSNILYTEGNMNNVALEFGVGMKIK